MGSSEHRGYRARVERCPVSGVLFGQIDGIDDLVTFECEAPDEVEREFRDAVDDYLAWCARIGKEPARPRIERRPDRRMSALSREPVHPAP